MTETTATSGPLPPSATGAEVKRDPGSASAAPDQRKTGTPKDACNSRTNTPMTGSVRSSFKSSEEGSSRMLSAANTRRSFVDIHPPHSVHEANTADFTINKLRFSCLSRLYGRDKEVAQLKAVLAEQREALDQIESLEPTIKSSATQGVVSDNDETSTKAAVASRAVLLTEPAKPQKNQKHLVSISGPAGSGKSTLALEVLPMIRQNRGFYLMGKFEMQFQGEEGHPFAAIISAFDGLCEDLALHKSLQEEGDGGKDIVGYNRWTFKFEAFVSQMKETFDTDELKMLSSIMPTLYKVVDFGSVTTSNAAERQEQRISPGQGDYVEKKLRLQNACQRFVKLISSFGPLVFVLDDVQWIDHSSLALLQSLIRDNETPSMIFIASYRDSEMGEDHMFHKALKTLEEDKSIGLTTETIQVKNLDVDNICALLEDLLSLQPEGAHSLAECIKGKTGGNALYVKEFLLALHRDELLTFEFQTMKWIWDIDLIKTSAGATENVVNLLKEKIINLPPLFTRVLPKVACLGFRFSSQMFEVIVHDNISEDDTEESVKFLASLVGGDSETSAATSSEASTEDNVKKDAADSKVDTLLAICDESGLVVDCGNGWYQWEHDKVQEAALFFVEEEAFPTYQFEVGHLLLRNLPEKHLSEVLFVVTSLLNSHTDSIGDNQELKIQVAELNLRAAVVAPHSSAFESAADFARKGVALLPADKFVSLYDLSLELYEVATEAHFSIGDHETAIEFGETVIKLDNPFLHKRRAYTATMLSLAGLGRTREAKDMAVLVLKKLGVKFPKFMKTAHILAGILYLSSNVEKMAKKLDKLELIEDERQIWAIETLDRLVTYAFQANDTDLLSLAMLKGLKLIAQWGISENSGPILATGGLLLVIVGNYAGAKKYADAALKYANRSTEARIRLVTYFHVIHYQVSTAVCKKALLQGYNAGLQSGDIESAFWCIYAFCDAQQQLGANCSIVLKDFEMYGKQVSQFNHVMVDRCMKLGWQYTLNMIQGGDPRKILNGEVMNEAEMVAEIERDNADGQTTFNLTRYKIQGCFWFKDYEYAVELVEKMDFHKGAFEKSLPGSNVHSQCYIASALSCISVARIKKEKKNGKHAKMAHFFLSRFKEWNKKGNPNTHYHQALLEAEFLSLGKDDGAAKRMYENAINIAGRMGVTQDQALAHERLAEHCMRLSYENDARYHFDRAVELYKYWGACARTDLLSSEFTGVAPAKEIANENSTEISVLSVGGVSSVAMQTLFE